MKQRILSLLLALALLLSAMPAVLAEEAAPSQPYEVKIDGVCYRVNPAEGYAEVYNAISNETPETLELRAEIDGYPVTTLRSECFRSLTSTALLLPDSITLIEPYALAFAPLQYVVMPRNEVHVMPEGAASVAIFVLPPEFSLAEDSKQALHSVNHAYCSPWHERYFKEQAYVKFLDREQDYLICSEGIFEVLEDGLSVIYLTPQPIVNDTFVIPATANGLPIKRVNSLFDQYCSVVELGENIEVVEDPAFCDAPIEVMLVPPSVKNLPVPISADPNLIICGFSGTYAEEYAHDNSLYFYCLDSMPFEDVREDDWFFPYVHDVYWAGLMNGTSLTTFEPETAASRAMIVQVLANLTGVEEGFSYEHGFVDVPRDAWYAEAVNWAAYYGIVNGTSETTFSPTMPVTREQLVTMLYRYALALGLPCDEAGDLSQFTDRGKISPYAESALSWAVGAQIINGMTSNTIVPQGGATRAQLATMLVRFVNYVSTFAGELE